MKLLHTSDWHLGQSLFGRPRHDAFAGFLDWLAETVHRQRVDVLLVAGDVFDTSTPGNRAQQLYYRFLGQMAASGCQHVVVVAGNHDSPAFLEAPRELLKALNVHVIGQCAADPADEVLLLEDRYGQPRLLVCAVPYLRDRDVRRVRPGESPEDKDRQLVAGIAGHYARVAEIARARRQALGRDLPLVATGHLFAAGSQPGERDGLRELYVGALGQVSAQIFPDCFSYVALGHLHLPQTVAGRPHIRYSGAPLPMGFGEAGQGKSVCLVAFDGLEARVDCLAVPVLQHLVRLRGDWPALQAALQAMDPAQPVWLEVIYEGQALISDLRERLARLVEGSALDILCVRNRPLSQQALGAARPGENLEELSVDDVFERCLDARQVPAAQRPALLRTWQETLLDLHLDQ